jgi:hypothetical protein
MYLRPSQCQCNTVVRRNDAKNVILDINFVRLQWKKMSLREYEN